MTKTQEIQRLRAFAENYPANSYLRPWLEQIIPEVESHIRADIIPMVCLKDAAGQCQRMLEDAQQRKDAAQRLLDEAQQQLDKAREYRTSVMREAERALEQFRKATIPS